jgi:Ca-activated chloride channel family protein
MRPVGLTRLHDAIWSGLEDLASVRWPRKALVVLTDGLDQSSEMDREALERMARSTEAAIFGIGVIDPLWGDGLEILEDLARMTGGEAVFPEDVTDLPAAWHRIARRIHGQYTIGYRPAPRFRGYHDVRVEVSESDLTVRTRDGYLVD